MKSTVSKIKKQIQRGFTLVEIAIVLVIIGLLIGGVLRGQELINSARVNSISNLQSSIQTAYFGFIDRYKFLPGDLTAAQAVTVNTLTVAGIASAGDAQGDSIVQLANSTVFFNNISQAGFISCTPCSTGLTAGNGTTTAATYTTANPTLLSSANTMVNVYGQPLAFMSDSAVLGSTTAGTTVFMGAATESGKPMLTTGGGVSSAMLAELDRKSDDGAPNGGSLRSTDVRGTGGFATGTQGAGAMASDSNSTACATTAGWKASPPSGTCQGMTIF